MKYFVQGHP